MILLLYLSFLLPDLLYLIKNKVNNYPYFLLFILAASVQLGQLFAAKAILNLPHPPIWTTRFIVCEILVSLGQLYLCLDTVNRLYNKNRFNFYKRLLAGIASSLAFDPLWYRSGIISQLNIISLIGCFIGFALIVAR